MADSDQGGQTVDSYARWRRVFGILFVVSTLVLLAVAVVSALAGLGPTGVEPTPVPPTATTSVVQPTGEVRTATPARPVTPTPPPAEGNLELTASAVAIVASCLTSLTSLIGFVFTTVVSIRKERRESQSAEIERQIRELELERQKLELERKRLHPDEDEASRKGD